MNVQGDRGHYLFTDNMSVLTDLHNPSTSDKLFVSPIVMTALLLFYKVPGTENDTCVVV